jgi:ribose transport system substrate-binding protein
MSQHVRLIALAATLSASLLLTACATGGSSEPSAGASGAGPQAALESAYAGVTLDQSLLAVDFPQDVQNVAIISCPLVIPSCAASATAVSDAVILAGWWPMVLDGGGPGGAGQAIRTAIAQAATVIVTVDSNCKGLEIPLDEAALADVPVIGLGGEDNCNPKRFASVTRWTPELAVGKRQAMVGALQADYAYGKISGEVNALVLTVADEATTKVTDGFTAKLTQLRAGKVAQKLELSSAEIADKTFTSKVVGAANTSGANAIIVPEDDWLTAGGLAAAIASDPETAELLVIGHGGTAAALDIIRSGGAGLTATVGQAFDWMGWGAVDAIVRLYAGAPTVFIGDAMQVIDIDHNMPETGKYTGGIDAQEKYTALWVRQTPTPTSTTRANQDSEN